MKKVYLSVMTALISALMFAQDNGGTKKVDVNINSHDGGGGSFWGSPLLWIIGAAVFILLLVALTRGGGKSAD